MNKNTLLKAVREVWFYLEPAIIICEIGLVIIFLLWVGKRVLL